MNNNIRLGLVCMRKLAKNEVEFKTTTKTRFLKDIDELGVKPAHMKIKQIALHNLEKTLEIVQYCIQNNIQVYRMSSSIIPLASLSQMKWAYWKDKDVIKICDSIKYLIKLAQIRVSFHVDQFVILTNSDNETAFNNSLRELEYHNQLCDLLGCDTILIHVGGIYGNKEKAIETFKNNFYRLPKSIQGRIHLENDDKSYNVEDVLGICEDLKIPMVCDFHHDRCLSSEYDIEYYLERIIETWNGNIPKFHLSSSKDANKVISSHHDYINVEDYNRVVEVVSRFTNKFDIMIEAKCKDLAIFRLRNENK